MGYAVPAAIGAKIAAPDRTVVGLAGDGGFSMSAFEIETAVRERVDVTYVVFRNGLQGTIAMHQARGMGRLSGVRIGDMDIAGLATSLGAHGVTVSAESDLRDALRAAVAIPGPSVVEVLTDPEVISPGSTLSALLGPRSAEARDAARWSASRSGVLVSKLNVPAGGELAARPLVRWVHPAQR